MISGGKQMKKLKVIAGSKQIYTTHEDENQVEVTASVSEKNDSMYIIFDHIDETTKQEVHTMVKIKEDKVDVRRKGAINNNLIFDKNKPYATEYETPYGVLDIKIITQAINYKILQSHVNLEIKYEIIMQGKKISDNIYFIRNC